MKKKLCLTLSTLTLSAFMCFAAACGDDPEPGPGPQEETYTVTFINGDTVVDTKTAKKGEKITVPAAPANEDARYSFVDWEGRAPGAEVTVLGDRTYNAVWNEMFGSNKTFGITERNLTKEIAVDGAGSDPAWADAEAFDLDENGSTLKILWDSEALYLYADLVKATEAAPQAENSKDSLIVTLDLLHSDKLAADNWNGIYWGGVYRGEPGPMVEGGYTIDLATSEVKKSMEWLSNSGYGSSAAQSVATEGGYAVEFKIDLTDNNIGEYKPATNQEIGLAVRTADGASALETFKGYGDHGPKSLSNLKLMPNGENADTIWTVREVREYYDVTVDGIEDRYRNGGSSYYSLYSDTIANEAEGYAVKALWKEGKIYLFATFEEYENPADSVTSLEVTAFGQTVTLTPNDPEVALEAEEIALNAFSFLTVKVNGETTVDGANYEGAISLSANPNNYGRKMMEAKQLATGATINVDGVLDEAYGEKVTDINTVTLTENGGTPQATGELYIRWDDEFLYVFVDVTDSDVSTAQRGEAHANDSVEVWLDTCQQFQGGQGWGDNNRPVGLYRGELGYRVVAGQVGGDTWSHWLGDDARTRPTAASVVTETGYTVEYKIPWGKKCDEWDDGFANYIPALDAHVGDANYTKIGQIVNLTVNINDDNGQDGVREGIMSTNVKGCEAWATPRYLDHLKLVAAD